MLKFPARIVCFAMTASSLSTPSPSSRNFQEPKSVPYNAVYTALGTIPDQTWDDAAASLLEKGVATVRLSTPSDGSLLPPTSLNEIHSQAFRSARLALDHALYRENPTIDTVQDDDDDDDSPGTDQFLPMIPPEADSAHVTGFHHAGGMSRYNVRREGIVFSDDRCACNGSGNEDNDNDSDSDNDKGHSRHHNDERSSSLSNLSGMFWSLHGIADRVLLAIEKQLELSETLSHSHSRSDPDSKNKGCDSLEPGQLTPGWFQRQLGPTETSSQWHVKRFVIGEEEEMVDDSGTVSNPTTALRTETGERITLPMHTDPSLISVVIHDIHGASERMDGGSCNNEGSKEAPGALGLQFYHSKEKRWEEPEAHGHSIATIFVGSVLAHLTCGKYPAAKHRVVETRDEHVTYTGRPLPKRMAATLFVRPQPSALLQVPLPSPWLLQQIEEDELQKEKHANHPNPSSKKKKKASAKPPITFDAWLKRVARNYEKQKKKQKNKTRKTT